MIVVLAILCVVLTAMLGVSVRYNIKHAQVILDVEDAISEALDVCDNSYRKMSDVLEMPVALDSPEVQLIVKQISAVHASILYVSNVLASPYGGVIIEEEDTDGVEHG